jgi:mercuric ion transport protein
MRSVFTTKTALIGGLMAGIGASVCCVGPLLLLSLGISGAWISHLTVVESYRPFLIALAVVFLGLAFRKLYLVPQNCLTGDECIAKRKRSLQRILFWVLAPITLGLIASPWILSILYR